MHTDSETTDISLLGFMPYMIVVSLEMSDEPKVSNQHDRVFQFQLLQLFQRYSYISNSLLLYL